MFEELFTCFLHRNLPSCNDPILTWVGCAPCLYTRHETVGVAFSQGTMPAVCFLTRPHCCARCALLPTEPVIPATCTNAVSLPVPRAGPANDSVSGANSSWWVVAPWSVIKCCDVYYLTCVGRGVIADVLSSLAKRRRCKLLNIARRSLPGLVSAYRSRPTPQPASSHYALPPQHPCCRASMALHLPNFCLKFLASCFSTASSSFGTRLDYYCLWSFLTFLPLS